MTSRDITGLLVSYAYATGLLALAEVLGRLLRVPQEWTRKLVHVGAGMWVFGILALFDTWYIGIIPFATFIGVNFLLYRFRLAKAVDAPDSSPGTIYFALAITILFVALWPPLGQSTGAAGSGGVMAMTWGDALAAIVGQRVGRHQYCVAGTCRSWEGSAAMLLTSMVVILLTLLLPGSSLSPLSSPVNVGPAVVGALVGALAATLAEAVSPRGLDNLAVPVVTAAAVALMTR